MIFSTTALCSRAECNKFMGIFTYRIDTLSHNPNDSLSFSSAFITAALKPLNACLALAVRTTLIRPNS